MQDRDEIRRWDKAKGGRPARVQGSDGMLRADFRALFDVNDRSGVRFLYDPGARPL